MDHSVPTKESRTMKGSSDLSTRSSGSLNKNGRRRPQHEELSRNNQPPSTTTTITPSPPSSSSSPPSSSSSLSSTHSRSRRTRKASGDTRTLTNVHTTTDGNSNSRRQFHDDVGSPFSSSATTAPLSSLMAEDSSSSSSSAGHRSSVHGAAVATPVTDTASATSTRSRRRLEPYSSSSLRTSSGVQVPTTNDHATNDWPFFSPPVAPPRQREPLVLDPSSSSGRKGSSRSSMNSNSYPSRYNSNERNSPWGMGSRADVSSPSVQTFMQSIRDHHATAAAGTTGGISGQSYQQLHATTNSTLTSTMNSYVVGETAAVVARSGVQAGFMQKLGANIPEFKRRFFVLKPESNLYYYLSPNDTEPRGRIDLEGATSIEPLPDEEQQGRGEGQSYRFVITWGETNSHEGGGDDEPKTSTLRPSSQHQVVLEARSKEIGEEWIYHMKTERVSALKEQNEKLIDKNTQQEYRIAELEKQVEHFRMVEKDRDGALEDARNWKNKFGSLDEALRLLTQQIRKPPSINSRPKDSPIEPTTEVEEGKQESEEEKKEDEDVDDSANNVSEDKDQTPTKSNRGAALLDALSLDNVDVEEILQVPGTYFSALANACRQQRESLRLAAVEAAVAVDDVVEANERSEALQKRMQKAEKHLLKLWEENCTSRKSLKQKKREKRVLVKEVKELQKQLEDAMRMNHSLPQRLLDEEGQMADTMIGSDEEEERLLTELEEHVASSIRLHERLVTGHETLDNPDGYNHGIAQSANDLQDPSLKLDLPTLDEQKTVRISETPIQSLLDDDSDDDSDTEYTNLAVERKELITATEDVCSVPSTAVASTGAEMGDGETDCVDSIVSGYNKPTSTSVDSDVTSPERINPLLKLDSDEVSECSRKVHSMQQAEHALRRTVSETGQATSRLACPLIDVVDTKTSNDRHGAESSNESLNVYHLTFYSKKIGIQFQKASPAPVKPRGLLTDAMTADLFDRSEGNNNKTAAELKNVASIALFANGNETAKGNESCPLALPEDIVLVCGFHGFDDSANNQRPNLGARLVAFDGISVEIGKWTFDAIRKAIKARGRPLTLSFRNDFLTTEQRATLTKAVMEVDAKTPGVVPRPVIRCERRSSSAHSVTSALSHDSEHFTNHQSLDNDSRRGECHAIQIRDPDESFKLIQGDGSCCPPSLSSHSSLSSRHMHLDSVRNFHSFSEAGSSTVLSTTLAPLVANLLNGVSERHHPHTITNGGGHQNVEPEYLRRRPTRLEGTPQHQDYQSNLL